MGTRLLPQPPPRPWEAKHSAPSIQKLLRGPWYYAVPCYAAPCYAAYGMQDEMRLCYDDVR